MNKSKKDSLEPPTLVINYLTVFRLDEPIPSEEEVTALIEEPDQELDEVLSTPSMYNRLMNTISKNTTPDGNTYYINRTEIDEAIKTILSEKNHQHHPLFKNIDKSKEFGVSRFIADRVNHLPKLLSSTVLEKIKEGAYLVSAESKDSNGNSIKLEHRFEASNNEEAKRLYGKISSQLAGIRQKIWLACWRLANELQFYTFSCQLTDLMKITYPERASSFSTHEKITFYDHLRALEQTRFVFSQYHKKTGGKKIYRKFEFSLIEIEFREEGENDKYPQQLTICLFRPPENPEKIVFVGAAFKNKTLELHSDDTQLASWIQTRKSQNQHESTITLDIEFLFQLAGLEKTAKSNIRHARKLLKNKLQRLFEMEIILCVPKRIGSKVPLKIR